MKSRKLIWNIKKFLRQLLGIVIEEINIREGTSYTTDDVVIKIDPVVPTDEKEDAEIRKLDAETQREQVGALLDAAAVVDTDILLKELCRVLEIDYQTAAEKKMQPQEIELVRELLHGQEEEGSAAGAAGSGGKDNTAAEAEL